MNNESYIFENPEAFYLLILIPVIALVFWFLKRKSTPKVVHSNAQFVTTKTWKNYLVLVPFILKLGALALMIVALARPRGVDESVQTISKEGIDIVLAMDVSTSMKALDFKPDRLEAAKNIAIDFVNGRTNDRIGLVIYAGESFTQCPITSDYKVVKNLLRKIDYGLLEDGTAIGMGLATSVSRLKESKAESKVIILLTDGMNNAGLISPETAIELAQKFNIRVYTISVGKGGMVNYPLTDALGRVQVRKVQMDVDKELMENIAKSTGGKHFVADNNDKLSAIYKEIEKLEKTEIQELKYKNYEELFRPYLLAALLLLAIERLLKYTFLKSVA